MAHVVKVWLRGPSAGTAVCRTQRTAEELLGQERALQGHPREPLKQHWGGPTVSASGCMFQSTLQSPAVAEPHLTLQLLSFHSPHTLLSKYPTASAKSLSMQPPPALSMALSLANSPVTVKTELLYPLSQKAFL